MKIQNIVLMAILACIATTSYSMKKSENKKEITKTLFTAIKDYNIKNCSELCETHKDIAHVQCEFEYKLGKIRGITYNLPLCYFLSLESNKENKDNDKDKLDVADILIKNTNSLKILHYSIRVALDHIMEKKYPVTDVTVQTFEKILSKKDDLIKSFTSDNKEELKRFNLLTAHTNNTLFLFIQEFDKKTYNSFRLLLTLRSNIDKTMKRFNNDFIDIDKKIN